MTVAATAVAARVVEMVAAMAAEKDLLEAVAKAVEEMALEVREKAVAAGQAGVMAVGMAVGPVPAAEAEVTVVAKAAAEKVVGKEGGKELVARVLVAWDMAEKARGFAAMVTQVEAF